MIFKKKKVKTIVLKDKECGLSEERLRELKENQEKMSKQFGGRRKPRSLASLRSYPVSKRVERDLSWLVKD